MAYSLKTRQKNRLNDFAEIRPPQDQTLDREKTDTACLVLGRALFGGFFLFNGVNHFQQLEMMSGYAASKGVPVPTAAVAGSGAMLLLGGLSLLLGTKPKVGASLLATFLIGVTPAMHDFWNVEDPQQRMGETVNFSKNVALLGAAILSMAIPEPWPASVNVDV